MNLEKTQKKKNWQPFTIMDNHIQSIDKAKECLIKLV